MTLTTENILTYLAIITLLVVVVGDRVLGWLKTRGVDLTKLGELYELTYDTRVDTQEILRRFKDDGLETAIHALNKNVKAQTALLQELVGLSKLQHQEHKLILDQMVRNSKQ